MKQLRKSRICLFFSSIFFANQSGNGNQKMWRAKLVIQRIGLFFFDPFFDPPPLYYLKEGRTGIHSRNTGGGSLPYRSNVVSSLFYSREKENKKKKKMGLQPFCLGL